MAGFDGADLLRRWARGTYRREFLTRVVELLFAPARSAGFGRRRGTGLADAAGEFAQTSAAAPATCGAAAEVPQKPVDPETRYAWLLLAP